MRAPRDRRLTRTTRPAVPFAAMTPSALLLRVLLILALVVNGIGSAVAAAHAHADLADRHLAQAPAIDDGAPCHEQAPAPASDRADPGNCCDGGQCACTSAAAAALVFGADIATSAMATAVAPHRLSVGHHAPALAHPIRPPIG